MGRLRHQTNKKQNYKYIKEQQLTMKKITFAILILIIITTSLLFGCTEQVKEKPVLWIYKTSENYQEQVSFILTETEEVGLYPALPNPTEIKNSNNFYYSTGPKLKLNYLVVTNIELSKLQTWKQSHSSIELKDNIIEMHPFEEAYFCDLNIGLTPDWEKEVPQITQSLSVGEIPKECEKVTFTPRAEEQE
jgi:hypothetical protein